MNKIERYSDKGNSIYQEIKSDLREFRSFSEIVDIVRNYCNVRLLDKLNAEEQQELKERVVQNNGLIHLDVHPYYFDYDNANPERAKKPERNGERYDAIKQALALDFKKTDHSPIRIIIEEKEHVLETSKIINQSNQDSNNKAFIIPSHWGNPEPDFSDNPTTDHHRDIGTEEELQNWLKLVSLFNELGVKTIIIGGTTLEVVDEKNTDIGASAYERQRIKRGAKRVAYSLRGCAGGAAYYLSAAGFDVQISDKAFPDSISEIEIIEQGV